MDYRNLLYTIPPSQNDEASVKMTLTRHPEVEFVSFAGVDIWGYATDEKIPVTKSEETLEEVRSVANLIGDMLETFIEDEALEVRRKNESFQRTVLYVVGVGVLLLLLEDLRAGVDR